MMVAYIMEKNSYVVNEKNVLVYGENDTMHQTEVWNYSILYTNEAINGVGIHLGMYLVSIFRWQQLWNCLQKIERVLFIPNTFYKTQRKVCYGLSAYIAVVR